MHKHFRSHRNLIFALLLCGAGILAFSLSSMHWRSEAASQKKQAGAGSFANDLWQEVVEANAGQDDAQQKTSTPRTLRLNQATLLRLLDQAPMEYTEAAQQNPISITLPLPDGSFANFKLEESPISAPSTDGTPSDFRAYRGQGIDDPTMTARFDWSPLGFHAIILSSRGAIYIRPAVRGETATYVTQLGGSGAESFQCGVSEVEMAAMEARRLSLSPNVVSGTTLRVYRLAVAATAEYTQQYGGGNKDTALNAIKTTVNLINAIYQQELSIKLMLVSDNEERNIIFTNTLTDGYTDNGNGSNPNPNAMLNENAAVLANSGIVYDIGHVFGGIVVDPNSASFSGEASLGVVCDTNKARGASTMGGFTPDADIFVRGIAHEFGHQFSANHSFNATTNTFCGGQRSALSAYEPGSGSTLMGYSVCRTSNTNTEVLQNPNNSYLHNNSLEQIVAYANTATCNQANWVATGNTPPTVNAGANFTIPANTPFALTATGNDADNDPITYGWEQFDLGTAGPPNTDNGNRPIFRSYLPVSSPVRYFPSLQYILNNANNPPTFYQCGTNGQGPVSCLTGESLAVTNRTMNFRVTVRDNRAAGGGINSAGMQVTVVANAGPFTVTQPNTAVTWTGGSNQTVTWNVAGTTAAPINAANVKLSLSVDGGQTFPVVLAENTPNDGNQSITVPNVNTTTARLKVEAVGNIFFDISDANFTITAGACPNVTINPAQLPNGAVNTAYNQTLTASGGTAPYTFTLQAGLSTTTRFDAVGPVNIPDENPAGADLPITVTGVTTPLSKVTVSLQIKHDYVKDLKLQLISPDNTTVDLAVNRGPATQTTGYGTACNPDASRTTFDDAAATSIANGVAPFEGTFKPDQLLAAFNGKAGAAVNGQWKLRAVDSLGGDVGVINCVSLVLTQTQAAPGLTLSSNGTLSGTPTTAGTFNFTVKATDAGGCMGTQAYALIVNAAGACPTVNNLNPTNGAVGSQVVITGTNFTGVNGVKFSNNVVANFTVDSATQITATVPVGAVTGPITISKTGCNDVQTATFTVNAACPTVGNIAPTNGAVGAQVVITGTNFTGVNGVKFSNNVNAIFNVDSATQITATVPAGAVTGPITISKTGCNDVQTATFTVNAGCPAITITPANLTAGTVNTAYNQALTATGGAAPYAFALDGGNGGTSRFDATGAVNIPDGNLAGIDVPINVTGINAPLTKVTVALYLTHTYVEDLKLQLIGPDATTVNLSVKRGGNGDNYGAACAPDAQRTTFDDAAATLITAGAPPFVGTFRPEEMLAAFNGKAGAAVNGQWKLHVVDDSEVDTGAIQCVSLFLTTTAAPAPGLALATNGTLSGTPTTAGTFNFTVKATDANGCMGTKAYALTINPGGVACPTVTGLNPTNGVVGAQVVITGTNFTGVTGVKFSNNLAATFTVNSATQITATVPTGAVTGPITISKTGCNDVQTASFTVCTGAAQVLQVDNGAYAMSDGVLNPNPQTYFVNRLTPTSYPATLSQVLLRFDFVQAGEPITLVVAPNPTGSATINNLAFQTVNITAPGGAGFGDPVLLDAYNVPAITINSGDFVVGFGLASNIGTNVSPMAADNNIPARSRSYKSGSLTTFGQPVDKNYFIRARYLTGCGGGCPTITISPTDPTLTAGTVNTAYNQLFLQQGGAGAVNFNISAGTLPPGLNLATSGQLSGTPTAAGTFNFTVRATDANQCTGERAYTLTINAVGGTGLQFYPLAAPVRLLDTRAGQAACSTPNAPIAGQTSLMQAGRNICGIPANAQALTGNVTTVNSGGGFLTLYPSNAVQPTVASTNYAPNEIINNVFTVGLGTDGAFKIFAFNTTDVVVDVTGYYAPPATGGLYFHPLPKPIRLLETRAGQGGCTTPGQPIQGGDAGTRTQQARITCDGTTIPTGALAIVGNATTVNPQGVGFLTLFPGNAARPLVAASNYGTGQVVNGPFSVGLAPNGEFKIYTFATTDLVVDVLGYYSTEANDVNGAGLLFNPLPKPVRLLETRAGQPVGCNLPGAPLNGQQEYTQGARGTCDGVTIPANALGVVGNATVVGPNGPGFLTLWPSSAARPLVATANYNTGDVGNRHFIVGLGAGDGAFKMYSFATSHLVIDLSGYFAP